MKQNEQSLRRDIQSTASIVSDISMRAVSSSRHALRQLLRNQSGTSIMELAIAAPIFVILGIGISDLSHNLTARHAVNSALNTAMELAQLGPVAGGYEHVRAEAASAADIRLDNVTLEQWLECDNQNRDFYAACDTGQMALRYIRLEVRKSYTPIFGRMGYSTVEPDGTTTIRSQSFLRVGT